jgi:hypothetical protein
VLPKDRDAMDQDMARKVDLSVVIPVYNKADAGIVLLMFLENVFPSIPSELVMPAAGFTAACGEQSLTGVVFVAIDSPGDPRLTGRPAIRVAVRVAEGS